MMGAEDAPLWIQTLCASRLRMHVMYKCRLKLLLPLLHSKAHSCFSSSQNISWGEGSGIYLPRDSGGILSQCQMLLFPQKLQCPGFPCVRECLHTERDCMVQESLCS